MSSRGLSTDLYPSPEGPWTVAALEAALTEAGRHLRAEAAAPAVCFRRDCSRPECLPAAAAYRHRGAKPPSHGGGVSIGT